MSSQQPGGYGQQPGGPNQFPPPPGPPPPQGETQYFPPPPSGQGQYQGAPAYDQQPSQGGYYPPPPPQQQQGNYPPPPQQHPGGFPPPPQQQQQQGGYPPPPQQQQASFPPPPNYQQGGYDGSQASSQNSSAWDKTKGKGKSWFQKIGAPVNKLSNKLGAEAFWPSSLEDESEKAARILRSFCIDGFMTDQGTPSVDQKKAKHLDHIPAEVIRKCRGLAIFTVMRMGLHWSGAGGSGIIVAKLPDGNWSPPSGILIHTVGWGVMAGADIYDCVCVINNEHGMDGFTRVRCTLGGEVSAAVGPLGAGAAVDSELFKRQSPVWAYTKSKGLYVGVQVDGTIIAERTSENERFYSMEKVRNKQILAGQVKPPTPMPGGLSVLWETLQAVEGRPHDKSRLPREGELSPGDHSLDHPRDGAEKDYGEFAPSERMDEKMV